MEIHKGISPLTGKEGEAIAASVKAMTRLGIGRDFDARHKIIETALRSVNLDDPFWPEALATNLTDTTKLGSANSHAIAFICAWICDPEAIIDLTLTLDGSEFTKSVIPAIMSGSASFAQRVRDMKINSDEIMIRVLLMAFFRKDVKSSFHGFVADNAVKPILKGLKETALSLGKKLIEHPNRYAIPEGVNGMAFVISGSVGRSGYFVYPPTERDIENVEIIRETLRASNAVIDVDDNYVFGHELIASALEKLYENEVNHFSSIVSAAFYVMSINYAIIEVKGLDGRARSFKSLRITPFKAASPQEARERFLKSPQVMLHDILRGTYGVVEPEENDLGPQ